MDDEFLIIKDFRENEIMEGAKLAENGDVLEFDLDDESGIITGRVNDHGTIYEVHVDIEDENDCYCSCGKPLCKHQAAIIIKASADYTNSYVDDLLGELDKDELRELVLFLVDTHPEISLDLISYLDKDFPMNVQEHTINSDYDRYDEEDDIYSFYDDPLSTEILDMHIIEDLSEDDFLGVYRTIVDYIDLLKEEDPINKNRMLYAIERILLLKNELTLSDYRLSNRIDQWIENNQDSFLQQYDIDLNEIVRKKEIMKNNEYAKELDKIYNSSYLFRGPSTSKKVIDLMDLLIKDPQYDDEVKGYTLITGVTILADIYHETTNRQLKRTLATWKEENELFYKERFNVDMEILFAEELPF